MRQLNTEAFVCDTQHGVFEIGSVLERQDLQYLTRLLETLYDNYQDLVHLHAEMMSEC